MKKQNVGSIAVDAFFDNFTCAALFGRLRIPGSPREMIDPRPVNIFWVDQLELVLANSIKSIRAIKLIALRGILFKSISESLIPKEVLENFQGSLPYSIKLETNAHRPQ